MDEATHKFAHNAGLHMRVDNGAGGYGNHLQRTAPSSTVPPTLN
jgi:hypothetical protein